MELIVLPRAEQLHKIGTETLRGVEDLVATIRAVATIAVVQFVTFVA